MYRIKTIETIEKLKEVFLFISRTFYLSYQHTNETYFPMQERYDEMYQQFHTTNNLLYYMENEDNEVIAALTTKNYKQDQITLAMLCVKEEYTHQGIGSRLIVHFEEDCKKMGIHKITLGARFSACDFYKKHHYTPCLMVQVFDFMTSKEILEANSYDFPILEVYEREFFSYVKFEIDDTKEEYIHHFSKLPTATVLYVFTKYLD